MMKKIIALVLLISIPIGLTLSEYFKKPLLERVEQGGISKKEKDLDWEYIKDQFSKGNIDLDINYSKAYKQPILLSLENASPKDSTAAKEVLKELATLFPFKKIAFFSDFFKMDFNTYYGERFSSKSVEIDGYTKAGVASINTVLSFDPELQYASFGTTTMDKRVIGEEYKVHKNSWCPNYEWGELIFSFEETVSVNDRKEYIVSEFLKMIWDLHIHQLKPIGSVTEYKKELKYGGVTFEETINGVEKRERFLLGKIFSNDLDKQFGTYIYQTYPWRYAALFIDKEKAKINALITISFIGLLILVLSCSLFWNRKFTQPFLNYLVPLSILSIGSSSLSGLYDYLIHIDQSYNDLTGMLVSSVLKGVIILLTSYLFWQVEKRITDAKGEFGYQLMIKLGLTIIFLSLPMVVFFVIGDAFFRWELTHTPLFSAFFLWVFALTIGRGLLLYLNHFSAALVKQKEVELSRLKEINAQSELKLLQSHINPHFLYNALNSIAGLAHHDADKTEKMALSLSDLFRYSILKKGNKLSTIEEEVTMVKNYLEIEKIRFGDRLTFLLTIDKSLLDTNIPMYILQPLVENAIKHGVSKIGGAATIHLEIYKKQKALFIVVSDTGPDFPKGLVSGHGLQTVNDLLRLSYGENASLNWENTPEKKITITINQNA